MKNNIKKRESILEKALNKWAVINIVGNGAVYGFVKEVEGRNITINPHRAFRYNAKCECNLYKFVNEDSYLEVSPNGCYIEPTNKETLDYFNELSNKDILINLKERKDKEKNN